MTKPSSPERSFRGMRKLLKPIVERRRRDRINTSLETLRVLLLEKRPNEKLKNPKVEKADILENTVQFIRAQNQSLKALPDDWQNFRAGYHECLQRAVCFFNHSHDIPQEDRAFLSGYFSSCLNQLQASAPKFNQLQASKSGGHLPWSSNNGDHQLQSCASCLNGRRRSTTYLNQLQSPADQNPPGTCTLTAAIHAFSPKPGMISSQRTLSLAPPIDTLSSQPMRFAEAHVSSQPLSVQQPVLHDSALRTNRTVEPQANNDSLTQNSMVWRPWP